MHSFAVILLALAFMLTARAQETGSWPMLGYDPQRSGASPETIQPPFARKWYRLFPNEGLMTGVQPVVAGGRVFLGTMRGVLHALDAETGADAWTYRCGGAILHTAAVSNGKVFFGGADGGIYALDQNNGTLAWLVQTGSAVWNSPAVYSDLVLVGSRDQRLYAIEATTGRVRWTADTGGPLLGSPAVDPRRNRVYIGSEDMCVYAFDLKDGHLDWRSAQLPGVSLRGYHPVVAVDGSVLVTTAPGLSVDTFQELLLKMTKEIFGDFASWRHSKEANAILREENFALMEKPATYQTQLDFLRQRLTEEPAFQTFFVLDPETGRQKFVAPIVYSESMNGPGAPALVSSDGKVIVKFQALLRSRYEHYSPFLNVGYLDTATGDIQPIMDQSRTYGWHDSLLLVHDEQSQLSLTGHTLVNTHQDNVNGLDLTSLEGHPEPFCRNIHEPKPGEALAVQLHLFREQTLPTGKEWLARGTAVYGGGSVLDTSVSFAKGSFYYLPTHELSAGAALIAYRTNSAGTASKETALPPPSVTPDEWKTIQGLSWDWDTLESRRLSHVLDALPGKVEGTRQLPRTNLAQAALAKIANGDLEPIIWQAPEPSTNAAPRVYVDGMKRDLDLAVRQLVSKPWQPLVFPAGKFPEEAYRFFTEPTETLYTLSLAYPHLDPGTQADVQAFVTRLNLPSTLR